MDWELTGIKVFISTIVGFFASIIGGSDSILELLIFMIIVDFITGFIKAIKNKDISAEKIFFGGFKKITILIIVAVAHQLELGLGTNFNLREITITYYIIQELVSVIQNASEFTGVPDELLNFFDHFKKENDKQEENHREDK